MSKFSLKSPRNGIIAVLLLALCIGLVPLNANAANGADFKADDIISDGIFYNSSTLNASQIQAFLNAKVPTCDTSGAQSVSYYYNSGTGQVSMSSAIGSWVTTSRATYGQRYNTYKGRTDGGAPFTCLKSFSQDTQSMGAESGLCGAYTGGVKSAAQIIYDVSQSCGINPQVLLILLQKEQSLITDTWPQGIQYQAATGFACPDTASCDPTYYGFFKQVYFGARQYKKYARDASTYNYKANRNNSILYNPSESCGRSNVFIRGQATAGLYNYTPYRPNDAALNNMYGSGDSCSSYGNRNFWRQFVDWFGSSSFPQPAGASLYSQSSTGKLFLINGTTRFYISDWNTMVNYGLDGYASMAVSDSTIQSFTDGGSLTNLIWDGSGVYIVNNRTLHHVSGEMCTAWGLNCYDNQKVKSLGVDFQTQHLQLGGGLSNLAYVGDTAYRMTAGTKQPLANQKTLTDLGLNPSAGLVASAANSGQPLGTLLITTPGVIRFTPNGNSYFFDGSIYYKINDTGEYNDWAIARQTILTVPASAYTTTPPASSNLNPYVIKDAKKYIVDQGRKILIPDELASIWAHKSFSGAPDLLLEKLTTETLKPLVWVNPQIFYLDNGKKHYIATYEDFLGFQQTFGAATVISPNKFTGVAQGADAISDGQLVSINDGSGKIYVTNNHKLTHIPTASTFDAYGFNWGAIRSYPSSILTEYPIDTQPLGNAIGETGSHFILTGSIVYKLSDYQSRDFGAIDAKFGSINEQIVKKSTSTLSRFLVNSDTGKIYYASGGAIHYIATYSAFVAYGGPYTSVHVVNNVGINLFTEAQPVY